MTATLPTTAPGTPLPLRVNCEPGSMLWHLWRILRKPFNGSGVFGIVTLVKTMDASIWIIQGLFLKYISGGVEILAAAAIWRAILAIVKASLILYLVPQNSAAGNFKEFLTHKAIRDEQVRRQSLSQPHASTDQEPIDIRITVLGQEKTVRLPKALLLELEYTGSDRDMGQVHRRIAWGGIKYSIRIALFIMFLGLPYIRDGFFGEMLEQTPEGVDISANFCLALAPSLLFFAYIESISNFFLTQRHYGSYLLTGLVRVATYIGFSALLMLAINLKEIGLGASAIGAAISTTLFVHWYAKRYMGNEVQAAGLLNHSVCSGTLDTRNTDFYKGTRHGSIAMSSTVFLALVVNLAFSARMNSVANGTIERITAFVLGELFGLFALRILLGLDKSLRISLSSNFRRYHSSSSGRLTGMQTPAGAKPEEKRHYVASLFKHIGWSAGLSSIFTSILVALTQCVDSMVKAFINEDDAVDTPRVLDLAKATIPAYMGIVFLISIASLLRTSLSTLGKDHLLAASPFLNLIGFGLSYLLGKYHSIGIIASIGIAYLCEILFFVPAFFIAINDPSVRSNKLMKPKTVRSHLSAMFPPPPATAPGTAAAETGAGTGLDQTRGASTAGTSTTSRTTPTPGNV